MADEAPKTTAPPAEEVVAPPAEEVAAPPAEEAAPPAEKVAAPPAEEAAPSDLMTSARTLAAAAQAAASNKTDEIDKEKVAEAAENVLEAVKSSGNFDEKEGLGQYLDKAQGYLHQVQSGDGGDKEEKESSGGGAAGGFMKMAQGFFK